MKEIEVREAREGDVGSVRELFMKAYGDDYPYRDFYDDTWLKKTVFGDHYYFLVATCGDRIVGTSAVYFDAGTQTDLLGEFGRLVVDPEFRGQGIGKLLMQHRIAFAQKRLHFGFIEGRTVHPYAQRIAAEHGFQAVGFLPLESLFRGRESLAVMARHFGAAQELRRNHPRITSSSFPLAALALRRMGLPNDLIVEDEVAAYPMHEEFEVRELEESRIAQVLRIERGRLTNCEVFGNMMLSYGFFALQAREARYLVALQDDTVVGAIGYVHDRVGKTVKILELIVVRDAVAGFLLAELDRRAREEMDIDFVGVTISAYSTRMQHTLEVLGFSPVAYCPAYVFRGTERLDAIRMAKLNVPFNLGDVELIPEVEEICDIVSRGFLDKRIGIEVDAIARMADLFDDLSEMQLRLFAGIGHLKTFEPGEVLFEQATPSTTFYLILEGEIDIEMNGASVAKVIGGETLGEISLLGRRDHSATAVAERLSHAAEFRHDDFQMLVSRYPRIGLRVYRNLARSLGGKLEATDMTVAHLWNRRHA